MDVQRMKTLRELALKGTMAAVSESLHLSPSTVSQQISLLESEAGVALIERRGRGVQLTEAGRRLVQHADLLISVLEDAKTDMAALRGEIAGEVRLATFPSIARLLLPEAMHHLRAAHPRIDFLTEESEPVPALTALRSWQCDIAVFDDLSLPSDFPLDRLEVFPLYEDRVVAVLNVDHPLAARKSLRLRDLRDEAWAIDTRPNTFSDVIFRLCERQGFQPRVVGRFDAYDVIAAFVARGCAISVLPRIRVMGDTHPRITYRPLQPALRRSIRMAVRRDELRRPPLAAVVAALRTHARDLAQFEG